MSNQREPASPVQHPARLGVEGPAGHNLAPRVEAAVRVDRLRWRTQQTGRVNCALRQAAPPLACGSTPARYSPPFHRARTVSVRTNALADCSEYR